MAAIPRIEGEIPISRAIRAIRSSGAQSSSYKVLPMLFGCTYRPTAELVFVPWSSAELFPQIGQPQVRRILYQDTDYPLILALGSVPPPSGCNESSSFRFQKLLFHRLRLSARYQVLSFCPVCAGEQYKEHRFSWWQVQACLPGVRFCPKHSAPLGSMPLTVVTSGLGVLPHEATAGSLSKAVPSPLERRLSSVISSAFEFKHRYDPYLVALASLEAIRERRKVETYPNLICKEAIEHSMRLVGDLPGTKGFKNAEFTALGALLEGNQNSVRPLTTALLMVSMFESIAQLDFELDRLMQGTVLEENTVRVAGSPLLEALRRFRQYRWIASLSQARFDSSKSALTTTASKLGKGSCKLLVEHKKMGPWFALS